MKFENFKNIVNALKDELDYNVNVLEKYVNVEVVKEKSDILIDVLMCSLFNDKAHDQIFDFIISEWKDYDEELMNLYLDLKRTNNL